MKRKTLYFALILFLLLHQDFWLWNDPTLVLGFLPAGLAYHALYSLAAAVFWYLVITLAWPAEVEIFAQGGPDEERPPRR